MQSELKTKSIRAGIWSFIEAISLRGMQFIVGIILARLLTPEQFGLIGMLMLFTAVAQTFLDSGFGAALIQKKDVCEIDINSIFYFNIITGVVLVCCLFCLSPYVASFYNQPVLSPLLRALSVTLVINALGLMQYILLTKALDFKNQAKVTVVSSMLSGGFGVGLAYLGFGVWSIVGQQISNSVLRVLLLWWVNSWRPAWMFSFHALREMFHFGSKILVSGLLNTFFDNIYFVVIGKLFAPADLGFFTRANNLQQLPSKTLASVVGRVTFPVFSIIQDDHKRVKRGMKKALLIMVCVNFPVMAGLAVVARPLILVLITDKWLPCIPYFQLLCVVGAMYPLHSINLNTLQALGKSDLFLRVEAVKKVIIVFAVTVTYRWGIVAMIVGQIITSILSYYLNAYYNNKLIQYSILEQIRDLFPYLFATLIMSIFTWSVSLLVVASPLVLLLCQIAMGLTIYTAICYYFELSAYVDIKRMIYEKIHNYSLG